MGKRQNCERALLPRVSPQDIERGEQPCFVWRKLAEQGFLFGLTPGAQRDTKHMPNESPGNFPWYNVQLAQWIWTIFGSIVKNWCSVFIAFMLAVQAFAQLPRAPETYALKADPALVNKTHGERTLLLTPFYEWGIRHLDSVAIFEQLHSVDSMAAAHNDLDLALEVRLMKIHYYTYRDRFPPEVPITMLKELNELAQREGAVWLEIRCQSLLGNYHFSNLKEYEQAFEYFERTILLLEDFSLEAFPLKMECLYQAGLAHYTFRDYAEALTLFREAMENYRPRENDFYLRQGLNTLALTHQKLNQLDSASKYFRQLESYCQSVDNQMWVAISQGNLGRVYHQQGKLEEAIPLLEQESRVALELGNWGLAGSANVDLGELWLEQGAYDKARQCGALANDYLKKSSARSSSHGLYKLLAKLAALDGQPHLSARYVDSAMAVSDSLEHTWTSVKLMRAKQRVAMEQQKAAIEHERQAKEREVLARNAIIALLVLLLVIGLLVFRTSRLRSKNKAQALAAQKAAALQELEHFKVSVVEKNVLIDDIRAKLEVLNQQVLEESNSGAASAASTVNAIALEQLLEVTLLTEEGWQDFVLLFEQVHTGFFDRLSARWSNLTPAETRFLALSRLKLCNREMASMLGVGTDAIRQVKSRLRKKIGLATADSLTELVDSI